MIAFLLFLLFTVLTLGGGYAAMKLFSSHHAILGALASLGTVYLGWQAVQAAWSSWVFWVLLVVGGAATLAVKHRQLKQRIEKVNPGALNSGQSAYSLAADLYTGAKAAKKIRSERL